MDSIGLTGKEVETELDKINITVNKNQTPNDSLPPLKSSGVRIGTAAMTTKGWLEGDFEELAQTIMTFLDEVALEANGEARGISVDYDEYKERVKSLSNKVKERNNHKKEV